MKLTAAEIISAWKYPKPYDIYSMGSDAETVNELMNCNYYCIFESSELVGYYCAGKAAQVPTELSKPIYADCNYIDIGLGMKPELTGNGQGKRFFAYILKCIKNSYADKKLRLTVATFNKRAIHLYQSFGFKKHFTYTNPNTDTEFMIMLLN